MRSIIVGGGVGGCALAAALSGTHALREHVVVERRAAGAPAGMGFILMPNGLAALDAIAPERGWRSLGQPIHRVSLRSESGAILCEHPLASAICVGRERFLAALRDAALAGGACSILDGAGLRNFERDLRGATLAATLEDGAQLDGDLFFGADGARSRVRESIFPEARLSDVAVHELVSVAEAPELARALGTTFRKFHDPRGGLAVGMLAEGAGRVVWFIQMDARAYRLQDSTACGFAAFADAVLDGWSPEVLEAVACTDFARSHLWQTRDLPPLPTLAIANAALLGDAAHACLPFTSQGANGALEDAALLGRLLRHVRSRDEAEAAFQSYSRIRCPHHRRVFAEGRRLRDAFLSPVGQDGPALPLVA